jgi:beta-lactamase class A/formylglycine-generating enzyme required for sulfatase activity
MVRRLAAVIVAAWAVAGAAADASELRLQNVRVESSPDGLRRVLVTVQWKNGWRNSRNYDAVWLIVKAGASRQPLRHVRIAPSGHSILPSAGPPGEVVVSEGGVGAFLIPAQPHRGDVKWDVQLVLNGRDVRNDDVHAFGVEMVYVPGGAFAVGDPDPASVDYATLFRSAGRGEPDGLFLVRSEDAIDVGPQPGALFYRTRLPQFEGDRLGPIPASFPKGVAPFYVMKYETTQGDYAHFLNTLGGVETAFRAIHGGRGYDSGRGTVRLEGGVYRAAVPSRPANWISWNDGLAFADWAGLRPMTELEFTKACRGTAAPMAREFPWGTISVDRLARVMGPDDDLVTSGPADEATLADATRDVLGASFYWVMDLAGSVWERVITVGHPRGRAFRGTHGDGVLDAYGNATNDDWPRGDDDAGGYGYRGGGYYERGMTPREFNPYSPTEWRRYGSWGGGPRGLAYGFRGVRSAPQSRVDLSEELRRLAAAAPGTLGVRVVHVETQVAHGINEDDWFPMMSVYKLPIAIHALRRSESGMSDLSTRVTLGSDDRRPGFSPLARTIEKDGPQTATLRELLSAVIRVSDNTASDRLLREVGGPSAVAATLRELRIEGIDVSRYEAEFAADYYGVKLPSPYSLDRFIDAVERVADSSRRRAAAAFVAGRRDAARPRGFAELLVTLVRGGLLSDEHTGWLLNEMSEMHTRDGRLRAGLPSGTFAALRPGTSGETDGVRAAHNDTGVVRLPDGTHIVIAAFLKAARGSEAERDKVLMDVARATYQWAVGR